MKQAILITLIGSAIVTIVGCFSSTKIDGADTGSDTGGGFWTATISSRGSRSGGGRASVSADTAVDAGPDTVDTLAPHYDAGGIGPDTAVDSEIPIK